MQRVNLTGSEQATSGSDYERIAPPPGSSCIAGQECGIGLWLNGAAYAIPAAYTLGTMPRSSSPSGSTCTSALWPSAPTVAKRRPR